MSLWPTTKLQFERYGAETRAVDDAWYESVLAANARRSWRETGASDRPHWWITGIAVEEALGFAAWLGPGWGLPTVEQWRAADRALAEATFEPSQLPDLEDWPGCPAAAGMLRSIIADRPPTWAVLACLRDGVAEWVRDDSDYKALGRPHAALHASVWNPQRDRPHVLPHDSGVEQDRPRFRYLGLRPFRSPS